jgi:hypothetical protein
MIYFSCVYQMNEVLIKLNTKLIYGNTIETTIK